MNLGDRLAADLRFARVGTHTVLTRRRHRWPVVIGRVFDDHSGRGALTLQNAAGTVIPGDVIRARIDVVDGAWATVMGQGATLVSGVPDGDVSVEETRLFVDAGSHLRFDPSPRILTTHARHRQRTEVCVEPGGCAVVVDAIVLHPELAGGDTAFGSLESMVTVRAPDGVLLALDTQLLDDPPATERFTAFGTVYLVGTGFDTALTAATPELESLTTMSGRTVYVGISDLPNEAGWAVRIAAADGGVLRNAVSAITARLDPLALSRRNAVSARSEHEVSRK